MTSPLPLPASVDAVVALLAGEQYVCDRRLATALYLSLKLGRPVGMTPRCLGAPDEAGIAGSSIEAG